MAQIIISATLIGALLRRMIEVVLGYKGQKQRVLANRAGFPPSNSPAMGDKDDHREDGDGGGAGADVITKPKTRTKKPRLYKVLLLNDDYTPMDFVIYVLEQYFNKSRSEATGIMLQVHKSGVGICGVFTYEVAETKVSQVMNIARQNEHPLQCTMEKE